MDRFKLSAVLVFFAASGIGSISVFEGTRKELKSRSAVSHDSLSEHNDFHCDLNLMPSQKKMMYLDYRLPSKDLAFDSYKWPKNQEGLVYVPYRISKTSLFSAEQYSMIRVAMDEIEAVTCIRFKNRKNERDFVHIFSGKFCKSNLGRTGGMQELSLNTFKCFQKGIIIHELMHALGYIHMQSRPDRDKYVKIVWQNIRPEFTREFDKVNPGVFNYYGTSYDYHSIMHYASRAASKNGGRTIVTKDESFLDVIGQRGGMSEGDIQRVNTKYKCKVHKPAVSIFASYQPLVAAKKPTSDFFKPTTDLFKPTSDRFKPSTDLFKPINPFRIPTIGEDDDDLFNI